MLRRWIIFRHGSLTAIFLCSLAISHFVSAAPTLDALAKGLNINKEAISVSGISSGAFMAHQFHVAHSEQIMGAGLIAGGSYYCAANSIIDAITKCSKFVDLSCKELLMLFNYDTSVCENTDQTPNTAAEIDNAAKASFYEAKKQEALNNISELTNLQEDKIYLFSGEHDAIVPHGVMDTVYAFYADSDKIGVKAGYVEYNRSFPTRHTMVRDSFNRPEGKVVGDCVLPPDPPPPTDENSYIDDCQQVALRHMEKNSCICAPSTESTCPPADKKEVCQDVEAVDLAGEILKHIYGENALKEKRVAVDENEIKSFDQRKIFRKWFEMGWRVETLHASMAKKGYVYIPKACKEGVKCNLHVAFHGCLQGGKTDKRTDHSGNLFSKYAGYNEWAKANNIVVLYPQVESMDPVPLNPRGCWDWWGQNYTHGKYHTKGGKQIKAVAEMINILSGEDLLEAPAR